MNQDLLDNLKPIMLPDSVGFWPLAWGWWLLFLLVIVVLLGTTGFFVQRYKKMANYRLIKKNLDDIKSNWSSQSNYQQLAEILNLWIRESYFLLGYKENITGQLDQWQSFLSNHHDWFKTAEAQDFLLACYRPVKHDNPENWLKISDELLKGMKS